MNSLMSLDLRDIVLTTSNEEWDHLVEEVRDLPDSSWTWQQSAQQHSIGWHVRHLVEWRYLVVHGIISELPLREKLTCLGWEKDPEIRKIAANPGIWHEPSYTRDQQLEFLDKIRQTTTTDIAALATGRFREELTFPGGRRTIFEELILQGLHHSALHRGQIRELKKICTRQDWANNTFRRGWM